MSNDVELVVLSLNGSEAEPLIALVHSISEIKPICDAEMMVSACASVIVNLLLMRKDSTISDMYKSIDRMSGIMKQGIKEHIQRKT